MKNLYKNVFSVSLIIVLLTSCEDFFDKTIDPNLEEKENFLVIGAIMDNTTDLARVHLSYSVDLFDELTYDIDIDKAKVSLELPEGSIENLVYFAGNQHNFQTKDSLALIPGETYSISAALGGYEDIQATATMPVQVPIISSTILENAGIDEDGNDLVGIDIRFNDPVGESNYYKVSLKRIRAGQDFGNFIYFESLNPELKSSIEWNSKIISDATFDEGLTTLELRIEKNTLRSGDQIIIDFAHISYDDYQFDLQLNKNQDFEDNPFASAVPVYSNVENGAGIFALRNIYKHVVKL